MGLDTYSLPAAWYSTAVDRQAHSSSPHQQLNTWTLVNVHHAELLLPPAKSSLDTASVAAEGPLPPDVVKSGKKKKKIIWYVEVCCMWGKELKKKLCLHPGAALQTQSISGWDSQGCGWVLAEVQGLPEAWLLSPSNLNSRRSFQLTTLWEFSTD